MNASKLAVYLCSLANTADTARANVAQWTAAGEVKKEMYVKNLALETTVHTVNAFISLSPVQLSSEGQSPMSNTY